MLKNAVVREGLSEERALGPVQEGAQQVAEPGWRSVLPPGRETRERRAGPSAWGGRRKASAGASRTERPTTGSPPSSWMETRRQGSRRARGGLISRVCHRAVLAQSRDRGRGQHFESLRDGAHNAVGRKRTEETTG